MKKKSIIISLSLLLTLGSIVAFYSTNLLMSDLSNMFYGVHDVYILGSFPLFVICLDCVVAVLYIVKINIKKDQFKALSKLYLKFIIINSIIGLVTGFIASTFIYKSLFINSPFALYYVITYIVNALLLGFGIYFYKVVNSLEDGNKQKVTLVYGLYSAVSAFLLYFAMNKFGGLLLSPLFITYSLLYMTFPFYLSLVAPMGFVVLFILERFNVLNSKNRLTWSIIMLAFSVATALSVILIGYNYPEFVSAVSMNLPLERLATTPFNSIFQPIAEIGVGVYYLLFTLKHKEK